MSALHSRAFRAAPAVVVLLDETPRPDHHDTVLEAAMVCPATAIHLAE